MAARRIGDARLNGGILIEVFLDDVESTMSWMVYRDDQPFLRCPGPNNEWTSDRRWSEPEAAAFLLVNALNAYLAVQAEANRSC